MDFIKKNWFRIGILIILAAGLSAFLFYSHFQTNKDSVAQLEETVNQLRWELELEKTKPPEIVESKVYVQKDNSAQIELCRAKYITGQSYEDMEEFDSVINMAKEASSDGRITFQDAWEQLEELHFQEKYEDCIASIDQ